MRIKCANSTISMREVIITLILYWFDQKNCFLWRFVLVQGQLFETGTRYGLKVLRQCGKRVKTKSQKVFGVNSYVWRSCRRKTARWGLFTPCPPIQNRDNLKHKAQKYIYICTTWKFQNVNLNSQWHNGFYFIGI